MDCCTTTAHGSHNHSHNGHAGADFAKRFFVSLALSLPVIALSPMLRMMFGMGMSRMSYAAEISFVLMTVIFFYGGWPFLAGLYHEVKQRRPGMMTLVGVAISAAYAYTVMVFAGLPGDDLSWELVTLIDIMLLGHWIEMRSMGRASRALEALVRLMPSTAHKVGIDGSVQDVPVATLRVGDAVLVKPGEKIPVDGTITEGQTTVNESLLTGETKPVEKGEGEGVIGGSINGEASIAVEIKKIGKDTYLSQIIALVENAQHTKSQTQRLADRAAMWLTFVALSAGALTFVGWMTLSGQGFSFALERAIATIVIACPHALGLAIPLVVSVSTALSAHNGLLIRNRTAFEKARGVNAIIFDKTGTLTKGEFGVSDVIPFGKNTKDKVIDYAATLESHSEHPLAAAIAKLGNGSHAVKEFAALPGRGVRGNVHGQEAMVVSRGYLTEHSISIEHESVRTLEREGKTVVFVLVDDTPIGAIALDDMVREEAKGTIRELKQMGIEPMMLTGDTQHVAERVAHELGITTYYGEVLPHEKAHKVREIQMNGYTVAMVGDGVNDAPALAAADVGIAIGAGTDVAIESADIVLVKNDPRDVVTMITLARRTYRKMVQNLWWASGYNIIALPLAGGALAWAGIVLSPAIAGVLMSVSTVVVAINATLLRFNNQHI